MHFSISPPWQWELHLRLVHEARAGETPTILSEQVQRWKVGKRHLAILGVDCGLTMEQDSWSHWKVVWQAWVLIEVHSIIVHCTFQSDQGPDVQLYTWIGVIHITWQRKHQRKISRTHVTLNSKQLQSGILSLSTMSWSCLVILVRHNGTSQSLAWMIMQPNILCIIKAANAVQICA